MAVNGFFKLKKNSKLKKTWLSIEINKLAQSRFLLSTAKLNNFIAQIMAKHLEGSREIMVWLPIQWRSQDFTLRGADIKF